MSVTRQENSTPRYEAGRCGRDWYVWDNLKGVAHGPYWNAKERAAEWNRTADMLARVLA